MLKHRWTDRICCIVLVLMLVLTGALAGISGAADSPGRTMGYEGRLFDQSRVHEIEIVMDDWDGFLETCASEEYALCTVIIDGEAYKNVGIRAKGNTSLSSVKSYGNNRYSFKVEFDHYDNSGSYHGLDKLSLNNIIQDNTYMKDYLAYTLMNEMGAAAPLCSYASISVNGEAWGLYLAVEAVEESFLQRNYGADYGELYKPDSMSFGGGRGNGKDFSMDDFSEMFSDENIESFLADMFEGGMEMPGEMPSGGEMPGGMSFPGNMPFGGGEMPSFGGGEMPGGMSFGGGEMPSFGGSLEVPEAQPEEEKSADEESSGKSRRQSGGDMGGGFGGFGGMSSSDVRLQYSDDDPDSYSNIFNNSKTDITEADQERLIEALKALGEGDASVVDTEAVIRYLVVHNFMCNDDSYTGMMVHNYYLHEDDGVLSMIPWDYNLAMGGFSAGRGSGGTSTVNSPIDSPVSGGNVSDRPMVAWIFENEEYLEQYHSVYAEFVSRIYDSGYLAQKIDETISMISPYVESDPTAFCTYEEFQTGSQTMREFCMLRCESISGQLDGSIPPTSQGQSAGSGNLIDASHIDLSDMGSMGNMGGGFDGGFGGGFGGDAFPFGKQSKNESSEPDPAAERTYQPEKTSRNMPLIISAAALCLAIIILRFVKGRTS